MGLQGRLNGVVPPKFSFGKFPTRTRTRKTQNAKRLLVIALYMQDVMFELFTKNWEYGYVTNFADFESLATEWSAVVAAASETEAFVTAA